MYRQICLLMALYIGHISASSMRYQYRLMTHDEVTANKVEQLRRQYLTEQLRNISEVVEEMQAKYKNAYRVLRQDYLEMEAKTSTNVRQDNREDLHYIETILDNRNMTAEEAQFCYSGTTGVLNVTSFRENELTACNEALPELMKNVYRLKEVDQLFSDFKMLKKDLEQCKLNQICKAAHCAKQQLLNTIQCTGFNPEFKRKVLIADMLMEQMLGNFREFVKDYWVRTDKCYRDAYNEVYQEFRKCIKVIEKYS